MRSSNKQRSRKNNNNSNRNRSVGNVVNRVFDSAGPEGKVRGTPQQVIEKYQALARDAQLSGDRVAAENFQQHAEHYTRLLGEAQREQAERQAQQDAQNAARQAQQAQQANDRQADRSNGQNGKSAQGGGSDAKENAPEAAPAQDVLPGQGDQPVVAAAPLETVGDDLSEPTLVDTPENKVASDKKSDTGRSTRTRTRRSAKSAKPSTEGAAAVAPADATPVAE